MKDLTVELYTEQTNYAIIKLPVRKFPGVLFQGDSLFTLYSRINSIAKRISKLKDEELIDDINEIQELLSVLVQNYENVLSEHDIQLPYNKK